MSSFSYWKIIQLPTMDKIRREDDDDQYVTKSVIEYLKEQGFEHQEYNDSYSFDLSDNCYASDSCCNGMKGCDCCGHTYDPTISNCWKKQVGYNTSNRVISVYVMSIGIGIDCDNSDGTMGSTYVYKFDDHDSFVQTYNKVALKVCKLLSK